MNTRSANVRLLISRSEQEPADDVVAETAAMHRIAQALEGLSGSARERVLRWAIDRFEIGFRAGAGDPPVMPAAAPQTSGVPAGDPNLTLEGMDLFGEPVPPAPAPERPQSIQTLVHDFVSEFKRVADDWHKI